MIRLDDPPARIRHPRISANTTTKGGPIDRPCIQRKTDRFDELRDELGPWWLAWIAGYAALCAGSLWLTVLIVRTLMGMAP